jgi:hypothetical protein
MAGGYGEDHLWGDAGDDLLLDDGRYDRTVFPRVFFHDGLHDILDGGSGDADLAFSDTSDELLGVESANALP